MGRKQATRVLGAMLVVTMVAAVLFAQKVNELRPAATLEETLYVRSPRVVRAAALGFEGLAADVYWTRAVQYFGEHRAHNATRFDLLAPLLELTTDLDPHLIVAYQFGSIFLAEKPPQGAGDPDAAVRLVQKGIEKNPTEWRLYYDLGFIHYMDRHDVIAAAEAFQKGAEVPGAMPWMKVMAATLQAKGHNRETSKMLWWQVYQTVDEKLTKQNALRHWASYQAEDDIEQLQRVAEQYRNFYGGFPQSWNDLIRARMLRGVPQDPTGLAYRLLPEGKVAVEDPKQFPYMYKEDAEAPLTHN
jgi:hypothetical protein